MKSQRLNLATLTAIAAMGFAGLASASPGECDRHGAGFGPGMHHAQPSHHDYEGKRGDRGDRGEQHREKLVAMLDLNDEQLSQFEALGAERDADRQARKERMTERRQAMVGASVPEQMRLRAEWKREAADRMAERAESMATFYQSLDERQQRVMDRMGSSMPRGVHRDAPRGGKDGKRDCRRG